MKHKLRAVLALFLLTALLLTACSGSGQSGKTADGGEGKLQLIATTFPLYDWTRAVLGDQLENAELTLLMNDGVDLHSYQPTVSDMQRIAHADLFVYVGGASDAWVADALGIQGGNADRVAVNLLEVLGDGVKTEEIVEGMEHSHEGEGHDDDDHDADGVPDEHIWLSLRNADLICHALADTLGRLDPAHADAYAANARAYGEKLTALDAAYQKAVDEAPVKTLLFADRFPFRYLVDDYGLRYHAAFSGCSAETEASFETVAFLTKQLDSQSLRHIMVIDGSKQSMAATVRQNSRNKNQDILTLDSMQSVTANDIADGATYLSIMEANLAVLQQALS